LPTFAKSQKSRVSRYFRSVAETGLEHPHDSSCFKQSGGGAAHNAAQSASIVDPQLAELLRHWSRLNDRQRTELVAVAETMVSRANVTPGR